MDRPYRIAFVMEQALGHVTHAQNLVANVGRDATVVASWALIPFAVGGLAGRLPLYRSNWTVRAGLRARRALRHIVGETSPDALFFHTQVPAVLALDWVRSYPSVVSLDATPLQYDALGEHYGHARSSRPLEALKHRLNTACYRAATRLVTWSQWAKEGLVRDYDVPAEKVAVVPPGVIPSAWARQTPRVPAERPVKILFVGADFGRKGGEDLLAAFRAVRAELGVGAGTKVELHLVTKTSVSAEPGVFVHNNLQPNSPALKALYHESDLFCLPTRGDCLPMVLSEAGAAGLPLVSTSVAAIPEIVRDGETGLVFPVGDQAALGRALRRLVEDVDLRLRLGQRATEVVAANFDAVRNAERLLGLLKETADAAHLQTSGQAHRGDARRAPRHSEEAS